MSLLDLSKENHDRKDRNTKTVEFCRLFGEPFDGRKGSWAGTLKKDAKSEKTKKVK